MTIEFDASDFFRHLNLKEEKTKAAVKLGVHDSMDDLKLIASNIAPIETGVLRSSGSYRVKASASGVVGELTFSATNTDGNGRFNYAYWTHEKDYDLGPQSASAPGMRDYHVGNKYLERPLKGESEKYVRWIGEEVGKVLD
jgi:hypothetical protein